MKKLILFAAVLSVVSLASCKKTTTCTLPNGGGTTECNKCNAALTSSFKSSCTSVGGSY